VRHFVSSFKKIRNTKRLTTIRTLIKIYTSLSGTLTYGLKWPPFLQKITNRIDIYLYQINRPSVKKKRRNFIQDHALEVRNLDV